MLVPFLAVEPGDLLEVLLVVLLLFGGAIQAIIQKVRGKAEAAQPRPEPPAGRRGEGGDLEGLDRWRELERGGGPVASAPSPRPAAPVEPPPRPAAPRRPRATRPPLPRPAPEPAPAAPDSPFEDWRSQLGEAAFGATPSEEELTGRLDEAQAAMQIEHHVPARRRGTRPVRSMLSRRDKWREAVLAAEVLGRPLGLRREEELPGRIFD